WASTDTWLHRLRRVDVLDLRRRKLQKPLRVLVEESLFIDSLHDLHVLLRHRPLSISLLPQPGGFEGRAGDIRGFGRAQSSSSVSQIPEPSRESSIAGSRARAGLSLTPAARRL